MIRLGVIGGGLRAAYVLKTILEQTPEIRIAAVADPNVEGAKARFRQQQVRVDAQTRWLTDADGLLEQAGDLDAVLIGTRCDLHSSMAIKVAATGLPLYLEKPVAINEEQMQALATAYRGREHQVVVSFPLRVTPLFQRALSLLREGRIGTVTQIQAVNNVSYGGVYFGQWYRDYATTGGLWLQKATHDFDYLNALAGSTPVSLAAMSSRTVYGGTRPAELCCSECDCADSCPEGPAALTARGDSGGILEDDQAINKNHPCLFSNSIRNQDAGSALIEYGSGIHAAYSQNFVARRAAGKRGATVIGEKATMDFDWYTDTVRIFNHASGEIIHYPVKSREGHAGGDAVLARMFLDVIRDGAPSRSSLHDGLLSAAMCLTARRSCQKRTREIILPPFAHTPPLPVLGTIEPC